MKSEMLKCETCPTLVPQEKKSPVCAACWALVPKTLRQAFIAARKRAQENKSRKPERTQAKNAAVVVAIDAIAEFLNLKRAMEETL